MFASVKYMPISTASSIFFTGPIWTAIFAVIFLKEKMGKSDIISLVACFVGIMLINRPWADKTAPTPDEIGHIAAATENALETKVYNSTDKIYGTLYALSGAIGAALAFICMRIMKTDIHYSVSPFWFSIGCTFLSPIFSV